MHYFIFFIIIVYRVVLLLSMSPSLYLPFPTMYQQLIGHTDLLLHLANVLILRTFEKSGRGKEKL